MLVEACYVTATELPEYGKVVATKPLGSIWSEAEQSGLMAVTVLDLSEADFAYHNGGAGAIYYIDGSLQHIPYPPSPPKKS